MGDPGTGETVPHIVGVERGDGASLRLFIRDGSHVRTLDVGIHPWLLTSHETLPTGSPQPSSITECSGPLPLRYLVLFSSWPDFWSSVRAFLESESSLRGQRVSSYADLPHLFLLPDPIDQWLVRTGCSFFEGLDAEAVTRCTLAFSAGEGRPLLSEVDSPEGAIRQFSVIEQDGGRTTFRIKKEDEAGLLRDVLAFFQQANPDLICGSELHTLYLPYLERRCALNNLEPAIGRKGLLLRQHPATLFRDAWEIPGRTILDATDIVLNADLLEIYGFFRAVTSIRGSTHEPILPGLRAIRERPPHEQVAALDQFLRDALTHLLPVMHSTPITPLLTLRSTSATRTEISLVSRSIRSQASLPIATTAPAAGGIYEAPYRTGLFSTVLELAVVPIPLCSLSSVPAVPQQDKGPLARRMFEDLRGESRSRHQDPRTYDKGVTPVAYDTAQGLTHAYLSRHSRLYEETFSKELTLTHRRILEEAVEALHLHNIAVLQHTDDSLLCQLPDNAGTALATFWARVDQSLPYGLRLVHIDAFDAAVSLGPRMFALRIGNRMVAHRKSRIPRFFEPFLRDFFSRALEQCLYQDWKGLRELYLATLRRIRKHSWHVLDFARQEILAESFERYDAMVKAGKRHPSAAYEAIRSTRPDARAGTVVRYYITGLKKEVTQAEHARPSDAWDSADPDENTEHYLDRLGQCVERFRILFEPESYASLFGHEDLFGFEPSQIITVSHRSDPDGRVPGTRQDGSGGISLDTQA